MKNFFEVIDLKYFNLNLNTQKYIIYKILLKKVNMLRIWTKYFKSLAKIIILNYIKLSLQIFQVFYF